MMARISDEHLVRLRMYKPSTYGINLGEIGREMEQLGLVEWVPPVFGGSPTYAITDAGRAALASTENDDG